eukprot:365214-Chlamydomonas_euryale.AAC.16
MQLSTPARRPANLHRTVFRMPPEVASSSRNLRKEAACWSVWPRTDAWPSSLWATPVRESEKQHLRMLKPALAVHAPQQSTDARDAR